MHKARLLKIVDRFFHYNFTAFRNFADNSLTFEEPFEKLIGKIASSHQLSLTLNEESAIAGSCFSAVIGS